MPDEGPPHPLTRQLGLFAVVTVFSAMQFTAVELALRLWGYEGVWLFDGATPIAWGVALTTVGLYLSQRRQSQREAKVPVARQAKRRRCRNQAPETRNRF